MSSCFWNCNIFFMSLLELSTLGVLKWLDIRQKLHLHFLLSSPPPPTLCSTRLSSNSADFILQVKTLFCVENRKIDKTKLAEIWKKNSPNVYRVCMYDTSKRNVWTFLSLKFLIRYCWKITNGQLSGISPT